MNLIEDLKTFTFLFNRYYLTKRRDLFRAMCASYSDRLRTRNGMFWYRIKEALLPRKTLTRSSLLSMMSSGYHAIVDFQKGNLVIMKNHYDVLMIIRGAYEHNKLLEDEPWWGDRLSVKCHLILENEIFNIREMFFNQRTIHEDDPSGILDGYLFESDDRLTLTCSVRHGIDYWVGPNEKKTRLYIDFTISPVEPIKGRSHAKLRFNASSFHAPL